MKEIDNISHVKFKILQCKLTSWKDKSIAHLKRAIIWFQDKNLQKKNGANNRNGVTKEAYTPIEYAHVLEISKVKVSQ